MKELFQRVQAFHRFFLVFLVLDRGAGRRLVPPPLAASSFMRLVYQSLRLF